MTYTNDQLELLQLQRERESRDKAHKRITDKMRKQQQMGREGDGNVAGQYINYAITEVEEGLNIWMMETEESCRTGRPSNASRLLPIYKAMTQLDRLELISGALGSLFNGISRGVDFTSASNEIGGRAENILMLREARREDDKLYNKLVKAMQNKSEERKRVDAIRFKTKVEDFEWNSWSEIVKATLGAHLIQLVLEYTDYFYMENVKTGANRTSKRILMTDDMRKSYNTATIREVMRRAVHEPMVVQPTPWEHGQFTGGGYRSSYQTPLNVAKVSSRPHKRLLRKADMPLVVKALNEAQDTAWRIRKPILELLQQQIQSRNDLGVLVRMTPYDIPADLPSHVMEHAKSIYEGYTHDCHINDWLETLTERDKGIVKQWLDNRSRKAATYKRNMEMQGEWVTVTRSLASATHLQQYEAIYFPYQLDFRGRVYSVTQGGLSPQGPDFIKGLLEFSEGKRLGKEGYEWLSLHTANVYGDDKLPVAERKAWVNDKLDWIFAMAKDPLSNRDWANKKKVDKPYQFLACCIELYEAHQLDNPYDYESRMPIALDGSCSGLQHLGMASRCVDTANAVNLVDAETPSDIYQLVADKAIVWLKEVAEGTYPGMPDKDDHTPPKKKETKGKKSKKVKERTPSEEHYAWRRAAQRWLAWDYAMNGDKLSRKIAKRSVMTYPYGSVVSGFRQQLLKDHLDPEAEKWERADKSYPFPFPEFDDRSDAALVMSQLLYRGVTETVKRPALLMEWMQKVSSLIAKSAELKFRSDEMDIALGLKEHYSDAGVSWETPLGFPVYQAYVKPRERIIDSYLFGKRRVQMTVRTSAQSKKRPQLVEKHKQRNGISPNVVHSLDASHLMLTTSALMRQVGTDGKQIDAIALIHDSFGTHAANTTILWDTVRETMANMYRRDIFEDLMKQFTEQVHPSLRSEIPELPEYGNFDIDNIKTATYAFA